MNITRDIIGDLIPLYVANECSADTRALVDEYLRQHSEDAAELRLMMSTPDFGAGPPAAHLDEIKALYKARRIVRYQSWLLGLAIFFCLCPFSVLHVKGKTYWLFLQSPTAALIYGSIGVMCWVAYLLVRRRSQIL